MEILFLHLLEELITTRPISPLVQLLIKLLLLRTNKELMGKEGAVWEEESLIIVAPLMKAILISSWKNMKNLRIYKIIKTKVSWKISNWMCKLCSKAKAVKCAKIITVLLSNIKFVQLKAQLVLHKDCLSSSRSSKKIIITVKESQMFKKKF